LATLVKGTGGQLPVERVIGAHKEPLPNAAQCGIDRSNVYVDRRGYRDEPHAGARGGGREA